MCRTAAFTLHVRPFSLQSSARLFVRFVSPQPRLTEKKSAYCRQEISRWQNFYLPFIRNEICHRPARHLQSANVSFADGKLKICNRQVRRWPSAKCMSDKWQNKILPAAHCLICTYVQPLRRELQRKKKARKPQAEKKRCGAAD